MDPLPSAEGEKVGSRREDLAAALAHERRRQVVRVLLGTETPVSLSDLAAELARHERTPALGGGPDIDRIKRVLHHRHLPRLADADLVVYAYTDDWNRVLFTGGPEGGDALSDVLARFEE